MPVKDLRKWQDSDSVVPLQCAKDLSKFSLNMHIKFDGHEEIIIRDSKDISKGMSTKHHTFSFWLFNPYIFAKVLNGKLFHK